MVDVIPFPRARTQHYDPRAIEMLGACLLRARIGSRTWDRPSCLRGGGCADSDSSGAL